EQIKKIWSNTLSEEEYKILKISKEPPRGYVIEPPDTDKMKLDIQDTFSMRIILVGYMCDYITQFINAVEYLGNNSGFGITSLNGCGKFKIEKVLINGKTRRSKTGKYNPLSLKNIPEYNPGKQIKLNFITPAEIKLSNNQSRLLMNDNRDIPYFFVALYKRLTILQSIYCTGIFNEEVYSIIFNAAKEIEMDSRNIEKINMKISGKQLIGFKGELLFYGNILEFLPMLRLGEYLHIGTETVYGFGNYEIVS
ncbi:MAG: CRISPR system precrRNA processing endoribonuclease RAMP protein Cas6, partial [Ignavibacteriaceae bacterium]|nr:CRISPR system precrRNA processing endoribonuclease RAMP protein Cas6 [Ignavibacteriaceae bacterium]